MKILHMLRDLSRNGGVQRLVYDLSRTAVAQGHQVHVVIFNQELGGDYIDSLIEAGAQVECIARWNAWRLWLCLRQADVVHAHLFPALYWVALLRPGSVYTEHNTTNRRRKLRWLQPVERFMYRRFRWVTCITPEVQTALQAFLGNAARDNTCVIYNGVDVASMRRRAQAARAAVAVPAGQDFKVAMVGSFTAKKDQASLVRALARLPQAEGVPSVSLHLAGDGPELPKLRELAKAQGVDARVYVHGVVTDIPAWLADKQLYVQSSHWEGFGLAAIEAMACDLPVLCADVPGLSQLATDPAMRFPAGDDAQLAQRIDDCRRHPELTEQLVAAGQGVADRYTIDRAQAAFEALYLSTLPQGTGAAQPGPRT